MVMVMRSVAGERNIRLQGNYIRGSKQKYDFIKIMSYEENMTHGLVFLFYQAAAFFL